MTDEQQKIKDNYDQNLKAEGYLKTMNIAWRQEAPELFLFMLTFIRDVFRSERFKGSKLLEIGSGATVHSVASASAYFPNITMSDYVVDNLEALKLWVQDKSESKQLQLLDIVAKVEGYANDLEAGERIVERRTRKSIKRIARCDLLTDLVFLDDSDDPETSPPFDMIVSCLCFETTPEDYGGYCEILKRVNALLKRGGGLIMCGFLQGSSWVVSGQPFNHIKLGEEDVLNALTNAGFKVINIQTQGGAKMEDSDFKYDKLFCVAAEKI